MRTRGDLEFGSLRMPSHIKSRIAHAKHEDNLFFNFNFTYEGGSFDASHVPSLRKILGMTRLSSPRVGDALHTSP